ncbi:MAG: hypothetical protein ACPHLK_08820 [Gammaproteobacteria bacterium]|jgi:hypothetical protein
MSAQLQVAEKRRLKRFSAKLKVYSQLDDELIGYSENLNTQGMMVVTKSPLIIHKEYKIWFGANKEEAKENRISITAYKVWDSVTADGERFYYSGLHFVAPEEESLDKIQGLLYSLEER